MPQSFVAPFRAGLVLAALCTIGPPAGAADAPRRSSFPSAPTIAAEKPRSWTGARVGIHAGGVSSKTDGTGLAKKNSSRAALGASLGYDVQVDRAVFGIEAEVTGFSGKHPRNRRVGVPAGANPKVEQNGIIALKGRAGYTFGDVLVYGTAGVASASTNFKTTSGNKDKSVTGLLVGAGAEYRATENISLTAEYNYLHFGKERFQLGTTSRRVDMSDHVAKVGVAYRF